jgi:flagellar M-ring protein FliF
MKERVTTTITRYQRTFTDFTAGQKVVSIVGTGALLLAAFLVFRWVTTPDYAPLFSNLSSKDASAIVQELDAQGVQYQLAAGGDTIMVPQDQVYSTRIQLSGDGLPASSDSGYSLLDNQSLSTSEFQEQTNFKRAMEGELSKTIEALDDVDTAVVHLALPAKQVFSDQQDPATASVLVATPAGTTLSAEEVQAIVHLVASSIDGMSPEDVTVADSTGKVLTPDATEAGMAGTRTQAVADFQNSMQSRIQATLDSVIGPGNSTVTVTADLNFDKAVTRTTTYSKDPKSLALSQSEQTEKYTGPAGSGVGGVLGPDGQMDTTGTGTGQTSKYDKTTKTSDNAIDTTVEEREVAPGGVNSLHVGIVLDSQATQVPPNQIRALISNAVGIQPNRGDTVMVSAVPFDRTAIETAKKELDAAAAADKKAQTLTLYRNIGIGVVAALILLIMWLRGRKKAKARQAATTLVVEQLREEAAARNALHEPNAALLALEQQASDADEMREELASLVERQPEDVANLLRGWLVDRA